jgi:NodT family efflux transporter outer membrane factor (OMF) lipoprotein
MSVRRRYSLSLCALLTAGCAVGPNYHKPVVEHFPAGWVGTQDRNPEAPVGNLRWWQSFQDPLLSQLIDLALVNNGDLKVAMARVQEARGARLSAVAAIFPNIDSSLSSREGNRGEGTGNQQTHLFEGGFDATWELDIFGGNRRVAEASWYTLQSRMASERQVKVSLVAEVVRTYLDYRRVEQQLVLTKENLRAQQETLAIVEAQEAEGVSDLLDVSRIEAQVTRTDAEIPELEAGLVSLRGSLGVLVGDMPDQIASRLSEPGHIPSVNGQVVLLNTPASVIANRPDVQVAERDLATATANQGVAIANWFPRISLSSLLGFQTGAIYGNVDTWNLAGVVRLPFIDFGRVRGMVQQADARQVAALATYEQTVKSALADVETSFVSYAKSQERLVKLRKAAKASRQAEEISRVHFQEGLNSLLDVLYAQQNRLESENSLVAQEAISGQRYAALYKAVGGGQDISSSTPSNH